MSTNKIFSGKFHRIVLREQVKDQDFQEQSLIKGYKDIHGK